MAHNSHNKTVNGGPVVEVPHVAFQHIVDPFKKRKGGGGGGWPAHNIEGKNTDRVVK